MSSETPAEVAPAQASAGEAGQAQPPPIRRWVWSAMEPDERETRLLELTSWVDWLIPTFELHTQIPRCWYRHPRIIEHLTALFIGWARTYAGDPTKISTRAEIEWVTSLHTLLPRLASAPCQSNNKHPEPPARPGPDGEAMQEWLDEPPIYIAAEAFHPAKAEVSHLAEAARAAAEAKAQAQSGGG